MTNTDFSGGTPGGQPRGAGDGGPKEMARSAVQTVKEEAATFADKAKDKALEQVDQGKQTTTKTMGDFANAIRKAGDELAQHDQSMAGQMVRKAADGLESLSRSVSDKRPEEMLDAVRDFARQNPAAFIAGSVLVGLAIGRFAKSSERDTGSGSMASMGAQRGSFAEPASFAPSTSAYPIASGGMTDDDPASPEASMPSGQSGPDAENSYGDR